MDSTTKTFIRAACITVIVTSITATTWLLMLIFRSEEKRVISPQSDFTSETLHIARCGLDLDECSVKFLDGNLVISDVFSISRTQFQGFVKSTECRQRFILMPMLISCFHSQYDRDFTISYTALNGLKKSTRISFRPGYSANQSGWKNFQKDLQTWTGDVLTPLPIDEKKAKKKLIPEQKPPTSFD